MSAKITFATCRATIPRSSHVYWTTPHDEFAAWRTFGVHRLTAACILSLMPPTATFQESRRSTRVPLKVVITVEGGAESLTCKGETIPSRSLRLVWNRRD